MNNIDRNDTRTLTIRATGAVLTFRAHAGSGEPSLGLLIKSEEHGTEQQVSLDKDSAEAIMSLAGDGFLHQVQREEARKMEAAYRARAMEERGMGPTVGVINQARPY